MYGIDFGTSNTVVTVRDGAGTRVLDLGEGGVIPSLLYFELDRRASVGARAMEDYASALERYRSVRDLYARFRFFQGLKLALKDEYFTGTRIFGEKMSPEVLVGIFLREVKRRADEAIGRNETELVLGRPVVLSQDPATDRLLEDRFRAACRIAGFECVHFVLEPVAAAAGLAASSAEIVLVFDFGGGTLDITIARLGPGSVEILSSVGANLGGFLLNEDLSRARIARHFGAGDSYRSMTGTLLEAPVWLTRQVENFHALPLADLAHTRSAIRELIRQSDRELRRKLSGLLDFLDRNLCFPLFNEIDCAKIALSTVETSTVTFAVPPHVTFSETITRTEFETLAAERVVAAERLVQAAINRAGIAPGDIERVVRVGGSSQVPVFIRMLERFFPGRVEQGEVFTSIGMGLIPATDQGLAS